jgi:hypothetical protein
MKLFDVNYESIPVLSTAFTRSEDIIGRGIQFVRGGVDALMDPVYPNHALLVTIDRTQKFATEETFHGLVENSLDRYREVRNRIVACLYWTGWDDPVRREEALDYLTYIRRKQGDRQTKVGKYNPWGLGSFIPGIRRLPFCKPHPESEWCSENVASIHKKFGAKFINKTELAPDQLMPVMYQASDVKLILNFYKYK